MFSFSFLLRSHKRDINAHKCVIQQGVNLFLANLHIIVRALKCDNDKPWTQCMNEWHGVERKWETRMMTMASTKCETRTRNIKSEMCNVSYDMSTFTLISRWLSIRDQQIILCENMTNRCDVATHRKCVDKTNKSVRQIYSCICRWWRNRKEMNERDAVAKCDFHWSKNDEMIHFCKFNDRSVFAFRRSIVFER